MRGSLVVSGVASHWFRIAAILAPLMAVAPVVLGLDGAWVALHLLGGATALAVLAYSAFALRSPQRWWAIAGVVISIVAISVVTGGGTIGTAVQIVMLIVLGAIYVICVGRTLRGDSGSAGTS